MPEERMIRINYPDKTLDNDVDIRVHLYYYDPNGQLQTPIFGINKEDVELTPSKDWKPLCFEEHSMADSEFCDGVHETNWMGYIQPELEENCRKCIYRKKE